MLSASYTDPRLAAVYDALNPVGRNQEFYLGLMGEASRTILEVGCGTGRLACALARNGHRVTATDPAAAMLAIARDRPAGHQVTWNESTASNLSLGRRFGIALMTGHVFQVFLDDPDVRAALATLRRHLAPGGRLALETRNPAARDWETWTPAATRTRLQVAGLGEVQVHYDIRSVAGERVTFETHYRFAEDDVVTATTLRFMSRDRLAAFLAQAGFSDVTWHGDWDHACWTPDSPEIIAVAR